MARTPRRRRTFASGLQTFIALGAVTAFATFTRAQDAPLYETRFYSSGGLRIEGYLYKPPSKGPFPLVIYNHGNRSGDRARTEQPQVEVATLLTNAGFAVFVPERRGFGKSEGSPLADDGTTEPDGMIRRIEHEADDVLAAIDYLRTQSDIDFKRVGMIGYSLGGQVAVFAASRTDVFRAVVDQAGGSLAWSGNPVLRRMLPQKASSIKVPTLCMVAENDATTAAVKSVCEAITRAGVPARTIIYPPFTPSVPPGNIPPGHLIFTPQGIRIWQKDTIGFLTKYLKPTS